MGDCREGSQNKDCCEDAVYQREVDFSTFVLSLGTSVLVHLGTTEDHETGETEINLPMARHVIDILAMLKEKTTGNLEEDENKLLDQLLFDLRLKYVEACSGGKSPATETKKEE